LTNTFDPLTSPRLYLDPTCEAAVDDLEDFCHVEHCRVCPQQVEAHSLWLDAEGLALLAPEYRKPFRLSEALLPRSAGKSMLLRACGVHGTQAEVLDPFMGFGVDAIQLARAGCAVLGIERHPIIWLMARDFARRTGITIESRCADGIAVLSEGKRVWDVIYLDPMFPKRNKKALPGLAMQHLRDLSDDAGVEIERLLGLARRRARQRVVLKRRLRDPVFERPQFQLKGQTVRFDVYA